jgi:hypothetical protein
MDISRSGASLPLKIGFARRQSKAFLSQLRFTTARERARLSGMSLTFQVPSSEFQVPSFTFRDWEVRKLVA